ncbi:MAG: hypothetical protein HDT32_05055 [Clostridiales bacterium]|nr:hypothetical protein [Clostridiales bacterium]
MIKAVTYQGNSAFKANLYALEIKSRFIDQNHADGYYTNYGSELDAQIVGNQIQIETGAFVVQGRMNEVVSAEIISPQMIDDYVGYIVARIETYHAEDADNCSFKAYVNTALSEIQLQQDDVYAMDADDSNKVYELPIYSFAIKNGAITELVKLIQPVADYARMIAEYNQKVDEILEEFVQGVNQKLKEFGQQLEDGGTSIKVDGELKKQINFTDDPQKLIDSKVSKNGDDLKGAYKFYNANGVKYAEINTYNNHAFVTLFNNNGVPYLHFDATTLNITSGLPQAGGQKLGAGAMVLSKNGIAFTNPGTKDDAGWVRVLGSSETDTVLEIATGDDGGDGEAIVARQYNTDNEVKRQLTLLEKSSEAGNYKIFKVDPSKLYPKTENGWTIGGKDLVPDGEGIYLVSMATSQTFVIPGIMIIGKISSASSTLAGAAILCSVQTSSYPIFLKVRSGNTTGSTIWTAQEVTSSNTIQSYYIAQVAYKKIL